MTQSGGKAGQKNSFNCRHNQAGGHEQWAKPAPQYNGPTQWEGAITRDNAQYRLVEKHGRECDLYHEICYKTGDAKEKAAHFDDQPLTEVRKKSYRIPTCQ